MQAPFPDTGAARRRRPLLGIIVAMVFLLPLLWWGLLPVILQRVDDDLGFAPEAPRQGGSRAVAMAEALILREVEDHGWTPNDPVFMPTAALDDMPNYQLGMMSAIFRFALEMTDQIGRVRGSSEVDPGLEKAAGLLKSPGTVWVFEPSISWLPSTPAEDNYRAAAQALANYDQRLIRGETVFDARADNLASTLDRIAADLGSASAELDATIAGRGTMPFDFGADDVFYRTKGRLYAYHLLLGALKEDFREVVGARNAENAWAQMQQSLADGASLAPLMVLNGAPDGLAAPNHLTAMGFYLLRARTQLREVTGVLQR